jgi:hypothetical protein
MALQPPSPQTNVPRDDAGNVVDAMLLDTQIKWIAVVFEATVDGVDQFTVTPYISDPTSGG